MSEDELGRGQARDVVEVSTAELARLRQIERAAKELVLHDHWDNVGPVPPTWRRLMDALWPEENKT